MKFYLKDTVLEAALKRIRWLFDEFEHVEVAFSGGKDSTVALNLALHVAEEKGRLPLPVMFIDQEGEWQAVHDYVESVMADPRVYPFWYQIPFKLFNATSEAEEWLICWDPERKADWVRPKSEHSIHVNTFGVERMHEVFSAHMAQVYGPQPACRIAGIRASESPSRFQAMTRQVTYKGETWGKIHTSTQPHINMYPLYDWSDSDIWTAIHQHGWRYCKVYDWMYQYGVPVRDMRVSSLHHETAVQNLLFVQEVEPQTWERLVQRLKGVNTAGHLQRSMIAPPKELPRMFNSWREYRDFLLERLITVPEHREQFRGWMETMDRTYVSELHTKMHKMHVKAILTGDRFGAKRGVFMNTFVRFHVKNYGKWQGHMEYGARGRMVHSALRADHQDVGKVEPLDRCEVGGSIGVCNNLITDGLPKEMQVCDALFVETPWPDGFKKFNEAAGVNGTTYQGFQKAVGRVLSEVEVPVYLILGKRLLKALRAPVGTCDIRLYGKYSVTLAWWNTIYKGPRDPDTNLDVVKYLAKHYDTLGDFCCGYGEPLLTFLRSGGSFVVGADHNPRCIRVLSERLEEWHASQNH